MKKSGLKVNQGKTEACIFYQKDCAPIRIKLGDESLTTKKPMNIPGVTFDCKLEWSEHITQLIDDALNKFIDDFTKTVKWLAIRLPNSKFTIAMPT
jgi:hypothetical protein